MDQVKEDETEKASRSELLVHPVGTPCRNFGVQLFSCWQAATSLFNAASSDNTAEQQAAEDALREAMLSTPSRVRCAPLCSYRACARLAATFLDRRPGSDSPGQHAIAMPAGFHAVSQSLGKRWFYFCAFSARSNGSGGVGRRSLRCNRKLYRFLACFQQIGLARHSSHACSEALARLKRTNLQHEAQNILACRTLGPTPSHLWNLRQFVDPQGFVRTGSHGNEY